MNRGNVNRFAHLASLRVARSPSVGHAELARIAPAAPQFRRRRGSIRTRTEHQLKTIDVNRLPVVPMHFEFLALFSSGRVNHDCTSVLGQIDNMRPHQIPDARADHAGEYAGADFEQPPGQITPETGGAGRQHNNYHGSSSSYCVPAATVRLAPSHSSTTSTSKDSSSESSSANSSLRRSPANRCRILPS